MGLFDFIGSQLLKVIDWKDDTRTTVVYRFPMENREIMNGSSLTVRESQVAVLVAQGKIADIFQPGIHKLETKNLPLLSVIMGWKYGFKSPFKAEVYFINTKQFTDQKWGTSNPIMMRDAEFGMVRIRGFGKYSFKVSNPEVFLKELFGTNSEFTTNDINEYLKSQLVQEIVDTIAESKISTLDLAANYKEFSQDIMKKAEEDFSKIGLKLSNFIIENISLPAEVERAMDKRTEVGIMSDKMGQYTQYQAANAISDAAKNEGGMAGMGVGLGAGVTMGNIFAQALGAVNQQQAPVQQAPAQPTASGARCSKCGATMSANARFCPECGEKAATKKFCSECGAEVSSSAKFCPSCGKAQ